MTPLCLIIISTLNSSCVIDDYLKSTASQSDKDLEILISDGSTTDGTVDLARQPLFNEGEYLSIIDSAGSPIYGAINQAPEPARGEWLYIAGSDNRLYELYVLEHVSRHLKTTEAAAVYGSVWRKSCEGDVNVGCFWLNSLNSLIMPNALNIYHQAVHCR
ncbi:MAG: glycosyltransferase [Cyanobacteriota bacterium]